MAIDPRLYEKLSGRSGDPYTRMGQALADDARVSSQRKAEKDKSVAQRRFEAKVKIKLTWWAILGVITVIMAIAALFKK